MICIYFCSISSLIHISLNIIDIFCLHTFLLILSDAKKNFLRLASLLSQAEISDAPIESVSFTGKSNWSSNKKQNKPNHKSLLTCKLDW